MKTAGILIISDILATIVIVLFISKTHDNMTHVQKVGAAIPLYIFAFLMLFQINDPNFLIILVLWLLFQLICVPIGFFTATATSVVKSWTVRTVN